MPQWRSVMVAPVLTLTLTLAVAGCGILDPDGGVRGELEENRDLWESTRPAAYDMVVERLCFCTDQARGPVRVTVQGTTATERVYTGSGEPVSSDLASLFPTVIGLFDVIEDAIDRDAHELRVTYDQSTGIPVDIWIDYDEHIADEEQGYSVTLQPPAAPRASHGL